MSAYWPPLEQLPTFDVLVFRNAQDVVDYAVASGSATELALTSDNSSGTYWVPFSKTTSATSNKLYIDNVTTVLSYNPFTSTLTATTFSGALSGTASLATNISLGVAGDLLYQSGANVTTKLAIGANTYILSSNGSIPVWIAPPVIPGTPTLSAVLLAGNSAGATNINMNTQSITNATAMTATTFNGALNGTASLATNISLGVAGDLLYQSGANVTAKLAIGTNTYILTSNGSIPVWTAPTTHTISTTATSVTPYFLVGSSSSSTSNDATLYKNVNVYVNPATGGIICNDFNILNANSEGFNSAFSSLSQFEFRNNSTSAPNTTVFYNNNSVGATTAVLTLTGDAGSSTFTGLSAASTTVAVAVDNTATTYYPIFASTGAGQKSLLFDTTTTPLSYVPSTSTLTATTFVGAVTGLASSATTVAVAVDNTGTTYYPIFASTGAGQKSLLFDTTTTALSYVPSTSTLTATVFNAVDRYNLPTTIASTISASAADIAYTNNNIGGAHNFITATSGLPLTILAVKETSTVIRAPTTIFTGTVGSASALIVQDTGTRSFQFVPNASAGALNSLTVVNDSLLYATNGVVSTGALTISIWSATTTGVRLTPTTALIGAGGAGATPTSYTSYNAGTTTIAGTTVNITPNNFRFGTAGTLCNIGYGAGATSNLIITNSALAASVNYTNGQNTFVGIDVGATVTIAAANNTFVGYAAGNTTTSATGGVSIGAFAGVGNTTGLNNVFIGLQSGFQALTAGTGASNVCIGNAAASGMTTTANGNTCIGTGSASMITTGATNTILGINAGDNITTGSNNICIGNLSVVPTAANSNQIVIGTSTETQFIQGQFNWRVGAAITATLTLATPYSQFYTITSAAVTTVTLQNPAAAYIGTHIMFKRRSNTQVITFTTVGAGLVMMPFGSVALGATVSMTAAQFQCELICDGTSWYQFNMT